MGQSAAPSTSVQPAQLYASPNALASHYTHFRVGERLLLTGHSHQAWPDCCLDAHVQAWHDAAERADLKWERAFAMGRRVKAGYADLMEDRTGSYTLASNTHELVVRFLSALPLAERPRLVTTDGEFHTIRRQLDRLAEEGLEIVRVPSEDPNQLAERLVAKVDDRTSAVLVSSVLFGSGRIVPGLSDVLVATQRHGAELLLDVYHALNVMPYRLAEQGLDGAFVVGGGYKYCQLGEGNCFLRVPPGCRHRPVITGWFAEFDILSASQRPGEVAYGEGAARFEGSTFDPTSHYRAAEVFSFFSRMKLSPEVLREVSQHQVGLLADAFDQLDADPAVIRRPGVPLSELGGFLVLETPHAARLHEELKAQGVLTDYRGDMLRFGPAPYLSDAQLLRAMGQLSEALAELGHPTDASRVPVG